jgi:hypothetical protein
MSMRYVGRGFEVVVVMALLPNGNIAVCDAERASEDPLVSTDGPEKEITRVDAK